MTGYELSRNLFDWAFENPNKLTTTHIALYFFIVERCNRFGWKNEFTLPTDYTMEVLSIRSYNTYTKTLNELIEFGFVIMVKKSHNQHHSNVVALSNFDKATDKALDKAIIKHDTKQVESNDSIIKHITINQEQQTICVPTKKAHTPKPLKNYNDFDRTKYTEDQANRFDLFNQYIDDKCPNLRKIKKQITIDTFLEFATEPKLKTVFLKCLNDLDNKPKFIEGKDRYLDLNKAIRNWVQNEIIRQSK